MPIRKVVNRTDLIKLPVIRKVVKITPKEIISEGNKVIVESEKIIKETRYNEYFYTHGIVKIEPHLNNNLKKASKTRCEIFYDLDRNRYVIAKAQEEVFKLINSNFVEKRIGFKYKGRT